MRAFNIMLARLRLPKVVVACLCLGIGLSSTHAQTADTQRQRTPLGADGLLFTNDSQTMYPGQYSVQSLFLLSKNPVVFRYDDDAFDPVIRNQLIMDTVLTVGVFRLMDVGLGLPIVLTNQGPNTPEFGDIKGAAIGDIRVTPRFSFIPERSFGFGAAVFADIVLPTGDSDRFVGDAGLALRPGGVITLPIPESPLRLSGSMALNLRKGATAEDFDFGSELDVRGGIEIDLGKMGAPWDLSASSELSMSTAMRKPFSGEGLSAAEIVFGVRARPVETILLTTGLTAGLSQGVGTPSYRFVFGIAFAPQPPDRDGDGLPDDVDICPDDPEDYDQFADIDGCPERDNDEDGILDDEDRCPNEPEDMNGVVDDDGCPDEGVTDRDHDSLEDYEDECPDEAEDFDDFEDDDGCPEPDNDADGVYDELDQCPDERETINGVDDWDGCPDEGEGMTEFIDSLKIEIRETVTFETARAIIKQGSLPLLDQVALQILAHPHIAKVRIEGHTDSSGPEEDNLFLSQDRADAVRRYLIQKGVGKEKLEAIGFGESRPIDTNDTPEGRAINRRVEFFIVQ
jgi:outer membrane protein OmpA-like peptidoglycan-associated protein